jgi:hypothetical protein
MSHIDMGDDRIDTVISHITSPYPLSIFLRMSHSCTISHIDIPYRSPISTSDHILSHWWRALREGDGGG